MGWEAHPQNDFALPTALRMSVWCSFFSVAGETAVEQRARALTIPRLNDERPKRMDRPIVASNWLIIRPRLSQKVLLIIPSSAGPIEDRISHVISK